MKYFIDFAYGSLHKYKEELCGDKVEFYKDDDMFILVMADGLGSGVRANILATLTSKIGVTMLKGKMNLDDVVETIINTLPTSPVLKIAYCTFTLISIDKNGIAHIAEFDNPSIIFIRNNDFLNVKWSRRIICDKLIKETRIQLREGDNIIVISDGYQFVEQDKRPWKYKDVALHMKKCYLHKMSARRSTNNLLQLFNKLYDNKPADDTTVVAIKIIKDKGKRNLLKINSFFLTRTL